MKTLSVLLYFDTEEAEKIQKCIDSIFRTSGLPAEELQVILLNPSAGEKMGVKDFPEAAEKTELADTQTAKKTRLTDTQAAEKTGPTDSREAELQRKYGGSILSVPVPGLEAPQAYNRGLELADGEFVAFMLTSSAYSPQSLSRLLYASGTEKRAEDLLSLRPAFCGEDGAGGTEEAGYLMAPSGKRAESVGAAGGMLDASADMDCVQLVLQAYVIRRSLIGALRFREELHEEAFIELLLQLLVKKEGRFFYCPGGCYQYTVPLEDDGKNCDLAEQKWWYLGSVRGFLLQFTREMKKKYEQGIPRYLQRIIWYLAGVKFSCNLQGEDKQMMQPEEVSVFLESCKEIFAELDSDLLYQPGERLESLLPRALRMRFLRMKAEQLGGKLRLSEHKNAVTCRFEMPAPAVVSEEERMHDPAAVSESGKRSKPLTDGPEGKTAATAVSGQEITLGDLSQESLDIRVINYNKGRLEFDGFFQGADFLEEGFFELYGMIGGKEPKRVEMKSSPVYGLLKCFGVTYARKHGVHIEVPVEELLGAGRKLAFYLKYGESLNRLNLTFSTMSSRLLTYSQKSYWRFDRDRYMLTRTGKDLQVSESSALRTVKQELLFDAALLAQRNNRKEAFEGVLLRLLYWLTRPVMKRKRIWITFDKLYKAGDNGEYMFRYCQDHQKEIDCYYVVNQDAIDGQRLRQQYPGRILYANTWKTRLMALHAETILATHAGATTYLGFPGKLHKYYKNLYQADNVCIQHGLSIQQIASFQNRLYANTKLYCCASPYELENISDPIYGYESEMLKMTGLARYDGLKNNEQKQILITPTWRKNAVHTKGVGMTNSRNAHFKETAYYRIYNSLINDERLIACAKNTGYRIIFLLHPAMSAQMEDYDKNDYVELMQATGDMSYEKILTESSLMVTDYSGVQFDFAYQRKPLIYYHPDELPPHYTEGGLIYSTMGFGPICTSHEQIIQTLCQYMEDGCRMQPEYRERADRFFAYDDFRNAERIYQEVLKFEGEK